MANLKPVAWTSKNQIRSKIPTILQHLQDFATVHMPFFSGWWTWQVEWHPFQNHTPIISAYTWQSWIFCFCTEMLAFGGAKIDTFSSGTKMTVLGEDSLYWSLYFAQILDPIRWIFERPFGAPNAGMLGISGFCIFLSKRKRETEFSPGVSGTWNGGTEPYKAILRMGFPLQ